MRHDPSRDWDRHCREEDARIAAESAWWRENGDRVFLLVCAMVASGEGFDYSPAAIAANIDTAARIVMEITRRGEPQ